MFVLKQSVFDDTKVDFFTFQLPENVLNSMWFYIALSSCGIIKDLFYVL